MKKIFTILIALSMIICFTANVAFAGGGRRNHNDRDRRHNNHSRVNKHVAIGVGAAILGAAIISSIHNSTPRREYQNNYDNSFNRNTYKHHRPPKPKGYWSVKKVWMEPVYQTRWNPGHYNKHGKWVKGRNQSFLVEKGYWEEVKLWTCY